MPATTSDQQKFMAMCVKARDRMRDPSKCPPMKVAKEFSHKPKSGYKGK